jgi:hypothetical protein
MQPEKPLEEEIDKALNRQTSEDDTHPSPVDPFRLYAPIHPIAEYKLATCYTHLGYSSKARVHFARVEKLREQADPDVRNTIAAR